MDADFNTPNVPLLTLTARPDELLSWATKLEVSAIVSVSAPPPKSTVPLKIDVPLVVSVSAPAPKLSLPAATASPDRAKRLLPPPKLTLPVSLPSATSSVSLPVPSRMSPEMDGGAKVEATAVCLIVAPLVLALRSIAMLRLVSAAAPLPEIAPLFSIRLRLPERSTIPIAVPLEPVLAAIVPLLRRTGRLAPAAMSTAVAMDWAVLPLTAMILPALRSSGVEAPEPRRTAVAARSSDFAWMAPVTPIPLAILTAPPIPPT